MVSCINISMSGQIYGPGPVRCDAGWKFVIHFSISRNNRVNVSRAEKLPFFPGYYFLMMSSILRCRAGATFQHSNRCPGWTGKDEPYWIMPPCVVASRARFRIRMPQRG